VKKVLIVSPHFPPINAPDMQRVRMSLPYYRDSGWDPVVLIVGEPWQDGVREPELLATLPTGTRIIATPALPRRLSRWLGIGNIGLRSWPFLLWRGAQLLRREKFDLVFLSNTQFITFTLGPIWKRWFGVPYVIDVQDPWRTDYYERPGSRKPPGGWKYQVARLLACLFEGWCFKEASAVMSVSPSYLVDLKARYPAFSAVPTAVIRFGASRADLEVAQAGHLNVARASLPVIGKDTGGKPVPPLIHLLYTGASGPVMPHSLMVLFTGFRIYRERHPERASRLRFHFVGTSYVAPGKGRPSVLPVAIECGVGDQVSEIPHRIGFLEALRMQQDADALLLLGSSDLAYSPSKLYLYYLTGRPILGLVFRDSVMERLLDELGCAFMVRFSETMPKDNAYAGLERFFDLAIEGFPTGTLPSRNDAYFNARYLADELTRQQCELFDAAKRGQDAGFFLGGPPQQYPRPDPFAAGQKPIMSAPQTPGSDYRHANIGELGTRAKSALKPAIPILGVLLGGETLYQIITSQPGGFAFGMISAGTCGALMVWRKSGAGLPLMPMIVLQHLIVYGLPLLVAQDTISVYATDILTKGGIELLIFLLTLAAAWRMGMQIFSVAPPVCYGLREFNRGTKGGGKLGRIGFALVFVTFLYQILERTKILDMFLSMLPSGVFPIVWALVSAAGTCGFFILSLLLGSGVLSATQKAAFWFLLASNCYIAASSFLLSAAVIMLITVMIGLFWSTGRMPWLYMTVVLAIFSYLNIGKVVMRERYWGESGADNIPEFTLSEMPDRYAEWFGASYDCLVGNNVQESATGIPSDQPESKQSLLERINNMQNMLYVIDAVETHHIELLYGKTYTIIPALLIPRFLWPDKPGTHEGQAILNVHFGRQDIISTTTTYIAWGLLPEAYGNFGPVFGSLFLGTVMGLIFAWIEQYTARKLVISVEGFVAFTVFLGMANSFELVASVLITSIEQAIIPIVAATAPFARRIVVGSPAPGKK